MSGVQRILLAIVIFIALVVGSFIWFVATWDADREESITWSKAMSDEIA